jgi:dTDP-4-dehydrorhamnose 3,5-epimerase-like enzyme
MHELGIKRTYIVENFSRGQVRAWHGHYKSDTILHCISGAVKVAAFQINKYLPDEAKTLDDFKEVRSSVTWATLTDKTPDLFYVPRGFYNGAMSLTDNTKLLIFSTDTFEDVAKDDIRLDWNKLGHDFWKVSNR